MYKDKAKTNIYLDTWVMQDVRHAAAAAGLKLTHFLEQLVMRGLGLAREPSAWRVRHALGVEIFLTREEAVHYIDTCEGRSPAAPEPLFAQVS